MNQVPPECGRLAAELRALRSRAGLSLSALGAESAYSKSSWERYLNGKALPPWQAVQALCRLAEEPEPKARALWELAESAWRGRGVVAASSRPAEAPKPAVTVAAAAADQPPAARPAAKRNWSVAAVALCAVLICATLTAGAARQWGAGGTVRAARPPVPTATGFHVGCGGGSCQGADPTAMLCGVEPDTLFQQQTPTGADLQIRYNPLCRAAWARAWATRVGDVLTIAAPDQPSRSVRVADAYAAQTFQYTPMVSAVAPGTPLRICLVPPGRGHGQCYTARSP